MSKFDNLNSALRWLNDVKSTYDFIEWVRYSKSHADMTKANLIQIKDACEEALEEIRIIEGETK